MSEQTCKNCRFRDNLDRCKRNPPLMNPSSDRRYIGWWPTVQFDDWCGEFRPIVPKLDLDAINEIQTRPPS